MTRPQYIALCIIGGIAVMAYLQSYRLGQAMKRSGFQVQPGTLSA